jgi:hypothetical protein
MKCCCRWGHTTAQSSKWLPNGFDDFWGPLLCFALITTALFVDAIFLQPLQLCMRAPVLPVWDGTLKHILGKRSQQLVTWLFKLDPGYMEDVQPTEPQHYQRTMYRVDQQVEDAKWQRLETFGQEQGGDVVRTDGGTWYLRTDSGHLLEIVFDVRCCCSPFSRRDYVLPWSLCIGAYALEPVLWTL